MVKIMVATALMVYFTLLIILILNLDDKSKIIKFSFLGFLITLLVAFFFTNELIMDYLISVIMRLWYFPSFSTIILILFITIVLFIINVFNDKLDDKKRIVNYIFASYLFIGYIIFMLLNVDVNSYNALYDGNSLSCLRYITRTFILWMSVIVSIKYLNFIMDKR